MLNSSPFIKIKKSKTHNLGAFAAKDIKKETKIIEYVGEKLSKEKASKRYKETFKKYLTDKNKTKGGVYIFTLNNKYDLDGNVPYNTARFINHSCDPNCKAINEKNHIWIYALKNIKQGEELTYNYGYSIKVWRDHPCKCGAKKCVGYIVSEEDRRTLWFLKKMLSIEKFIEKNFNGKKL